MDKRNKHKNCRWYLTKEQPQGDNPGSGWCYGDCPKAQLTTSPPKNQPVLWANWPLVPGNGVGCRLYEKKS